MTHHAFEKFASITTLSLVIILMISQPAKADTMAMTHETPLHTTNIDAK